MVKKKSVKKVAKNKAVNKKLAKKAVKKGVKKKIVKKAAKRSVKKKKNLSKNKETKKNQKTRVLHLSTDKEIAMDFAIKIYKKFDKLVKAIILFGSTAKNTSKSSSDIDLIVIIDDASIVWDPELIVWYREELAKLLEDNHYIKNMHITTTRLTTWWNDLLKGDPVLINVLRYGEPLVDVGGFFIPIKALLQRGLIKTSPEAIYNSLNRAPNHLRRSKQFEVGSIEGVFWAMVDSAQAALMSAGLSPPSPEHVALMVRENFVDNQRIKPEYVEWMNEIYHLHREFSHGLILDVKGIEIDKWQDRADEFIGVMSRLVKENIETPIEPEE